MNDELHDDMRDSGHSPGSRPLQPNEPPVGDEALSEDPARQGRILDATPPGTTPSHDRATFSDPVPDDLDPTSPESPEQTLSYQHRDGDAELRADHGRDDAPQQNLEDWRRQDVFYVDEERRER